MRGSYFYLTLLNFLGAKIDFPITVMCNNVGAIFVSYNAKKNNRTKHIDIRAHFVQQYVEDSIAKVIFVQSEDNKADTFTKNVSGKIFQRHTTKNLSSIDPK